MKTAALMFVTFGVVVWLVTTQDPANDAAYTLFLVSLGLFGGTAIFTATRLWYWFRTGHWE
jgi:hypothetical protein